MTNHLNVNGNATITPAGNISGEASSTFRGIVNLGYASTTGISLTNHLTVNGNATITPAGNVSAQGTLLVTGSSTHVGITNIGYASTTGLSVLNHINIGANLATITPTGAAIFSSL